MELHFRCVVVKFVTIHNSIKVLRCEQFFTTQQFNTVVL